MLHATVEYNRIKIQYGLGGLSKVTIATSKKMPPRVETFLNVYDLQARNISLDPASRARFIKPFSFTVDLEEHQLDKGLDTAIMIIVRMLIESRKRARLYVPLAPASIAMSKMLEGYRKWMKDNNGDFFLAIIPSPHNIRIIEDQLRVEVQEILREDSYSYFQA